MAAIISLTIYPIKSCAGIALTEARVTPVGLRAQQAGDREWMVVDMSGKFLTQREIPAMAVIVPMLTAQGIYLHAPGMPALYLDCTQTESAARSVTLWDDQLVTLDSGDVSANWFSAALGQACRLVRFDPTVERLASMKWTAEKEVTTLFSDGFPLLLTSQASLQDLNQKLQAQGRAALPMNRFRPNLVIDGVEAFEEDFIATLGTGKVCLQPVKPCPRCPIPAVDQSTGKSGPDPLDVLQTYRANSKVNGGITFGMNAILLEGDGEMLRIGQEMEITWAF